MELMLLWRLAAPPYRHRPPYRLIHRSDRNCRHGRPTGILALPYAVLAQRMMYGVNSFPF